MIRLEPVGPDNWRLGLRVSEAQKGYVSDDMRLLPRAYAYRDSRSRAYVVYHRDTPVGMAMYHDWDDGNAYDFSQLFIDYRCQGNGYGIEAARLLLDLMRQDGKYQKVVLCFIESNTAARRMYEKRKAGISSHRRAGWG